MDQRTIGYYAASAREVAVRYDAVRAAMGEYLRRVFIPGMRVLDVGSGPGRDLSLLLETGCDAYGVEPCAELRTVAVERHPELAGRLQPGALPDLGRPFGGEFDGVLCSAVLMHLPLDEMPVVAAAIRNVLRANGRLLLSIPHDRPGRDAENRDVHGRLYTPLLPEDVQSLFEGVGFHLREKRDTGDRLGRVGYLWYSFLFALEAET